jgi:ribonuclease HI
VGIAIIRENLSSIFRLSESCSIYTAEAIAILKTVDTILDHEHSDRNNIILSDSLSTLLSLKNKTNTTDIAKLIQQKISQSTSRGLNISLIWIPGHCNIEGNENADTESKKAAKSPNTQKLNLTTYADVKKRIQDIILTK